jgi:hypothetical protein
MSYCSGKTGTKFWDNVSKKKITDRTALMLDSSNRRLLRSLDFDVFFGYCAPGFWNYSMVGLGMVDKNIIEEVLQDNGFDFNTIQKEQYDFVTEQMKIVDKCLTTNQFIDYIRGC